MADQILITADEVANRLKVRKATILIWTRLGRIPSIRISYKVRRYDWQAVVDAIRARENGKGGGQ